MVYTRNNSKRNNDNRNNKKEQPPQRGRRNSAQCIQNNIHHEHNDIFDAYKNCGNNGKNALRHALGRCRVLSAALVGVAVILCRWKIILVVRMPAASVDGALRIAVATTSMIAPVIMAVVANKITITATHEIATSVTIIATRARWLTSFSVSRRANTYS